MALTQDQIINAREFIHTTIKNKRGDFARVRRNGKTKLWKTRPNEFKIPYKFGLYDYGYITEKDANNWNAA